MLKSLARNSFIYYLSNILTKGISFFLLPLYTSILSREDYGVLELMSIISTMVIILFTFQIGQGVARYYNELQDQKQIQIYTSTVIYFSIASFGVFTILFILFLPQVSYYLSLTESETVFAIASITLNGLFYMSQNQLRWKIKPVQEMISSLTYNLCTIGFTIYFIVLLEEGITGIFKAQCIGALIGMIVAFVFSRSDYGLYFSKQVLTKLLSFSLPLLPGAMSIFVYMFTDRICIKEMLGLDELGVYSVGSKIATILTFAGIGVSTAISPLIYKHYKEGETPDKIALLFRIFCGLSFILVAFLSFFADVVIQTMTNELYAAAVPIIPFLLYAVFLNSLTLFSPGLSIAKKTSRRSIIAMVAGILNLILNILLIPYFGIVAAAIATFVSFGLNFILLFKFAQKEYPINVSLVPLGITSIVFFCAVFLIQYLELPLFASLTGFVFCSAVGLLLIMKKEDLIFVKQKIRGVIKNVNPKDDTTL